MKHRNQPELEERWPATLEQAKTEAARCEELYQRALQDQFRGRCRAHEALRARVAWLRAESRVVDLRAGHRRPLEWA